MKKIYYYDTYNEDIIKSKKQDIKLKKNYKWLHTNIFYKIISYFVYYLVLLFALFYSIVFLRVKIKNKKGLKREKGYFLYCNHTHVLGDVFNPFLMCFPKRPFIICSPSNLGIPILGKILPIAGALPIPDNIHDMIKFKESVNYHVNKGNPIVIYPEAHLWPYATFIRDFPKTSFHFPYDNKKKVYTATTTYKKAKIFKRPNITIYLDGPFGSDKKTTKQNNIQDLHDKVYNTMKERSKLNNYEYITYKKKN